MPLRVDYGHKSPIDVFRRKIVPERHRLWTLSIPMECDTSLDLRSLVLAGPAESVRTLCVWVLHPFSMTPSHMKAISYFSPNITVLNLHDITTSLSSLEFPAMVKLTFRITIHHTQNPDPANLIKCLKHSPILEEPDPPLPGSFKVVSFPGTTRPHK